MEAMSRIDINPATPSRRPTNERPCVIKDTRSQGAIAVYQQIEPAASLGQPVLSGVSLVKRSTELAIATLVTEHFAELSFGVHALSIQFPRSIGQWTAFG